MESGSEHNSLVLKRQQEREWIACVYDSLYYEYNKMYTADFNLEVPSCRKTVCLYTGKGVVSRIFHRQRSRWSAGGADIRH